MLHKCPSSLIMRSGLEWWSYTYWLAEKPWLRVWAVTRRLTRLTRRWLGGLCTRKHTDALSMPNLPGHCWLHRSTMESSNTKTGFMCCVGRLYIFTFGFCAQSSSKAVRSHTQLNLASYFNLADLSLETSLAKLSSHSKTLSPRAAVSPPARAADGITPHSRRIQSTHQRILWLTLLQFIINWITLSVFMPRSPLSLCIYLSCCLYPPNLTLLYVFGMRPKRVI